MLTAVKEIGELVLKERGQVKANDLLQDKVQTGGSNEAVKAPNAAGAMAEKADPAESRLETLIEDLALRGRSMKVAALLMVKEKGAWRYSGIELEDLSSEKKISYLYREGSAGGANFSPSAFLTEGKKTVPRKVLGWFKKVLTDRSAPFTDEERAFLEELQAELKHNEAAIISGLDRLRKELPRGEGIFITLKFREENKAKYLGDIAFFRRILLQQSEAKDLRASAQGKVCSVCGKKKPKVLGNASVYAFYTEDKIGFIAGGFDRKRSWRNFPLCPECKLMLEEGKKHIEEKLSFRFCGLRYRYQLIPRFMLGKEHVAEEVLNIFRGSSKAVSLKEKIVARITSEEEEILDLLKDAGDNITLNFLFLQKTQAAERIVLLIEDVLPSRLQRIFAAKDVVDKLFEDNFTFWKLRGFFGKSDQGKKNFDLDKYFLTLVEHIFKDRPVDLGFVLHYLMQRIRYEFAHDRYFRPAVKDGLMVLLFLLELGLIKMEALAMEKRVFDPLFEKYASTFALPWKRGVFLLGALTELLLRKQYKERKTAPPFRKNLKGLKMDESDLKGLLPKVQSKLEEYNSFDLGKRLVAAEAAHYLLAAGDKWKSSNEELNFYFAAGMNLVEEVAEIAYPEKEKAQAELEGGPEESEGEGEGEGKRESEGEGEEES
jgi:CRISPR-associated protein Csh1